MTFKTIEDVDVRGKRARGKRSKAKAAHRRIEVSYCAALMRTQ